MPSSNYQRSTSSSPDDFMRWAVRLERAKFIDNYTEVIKKADLHSVDQIEKFTNQVESIYKNTLWIYIAILITDGLVFFLSALFLVLPSASEFQKIFAIIGIPASLFVLLLLVYRSPLKAARQIAGEAIKLQVVYLGYLRQVNQIDIGFKQSFVVAEKLTSKQMQETFTKTQEIFDKAMDDLNLLLDDLS